MFEEIKLGPCNITFGDLDVRHTDAGVKLHVEPIFREIKTARHGQSIVDHRIVGWTVKAIIPMKQTDWLSLKAMATFLQEVGEGTALVDRPLGTSMRALAKELQMHPIANDATDLSEDVTLWVAGPVTAMELGYDFEGERMYNVELLAYPKTDVDGPELGNYMAIGDPQAVSTLYTITFTATDVSLNPVQGVVITLAGRGDKKITNPAGKAFWLLTEGTYVWMAEKDPYDMTTDALVVSKDAEVAVSMVTS